MTGTTGSLLCVYWCERFIFKLLQAAQLSQLFAQLDLSSIGIQIQNCLSFVIVFLFCFLEVFLKRFWQFLESPNPLLHLLSFIMSFSFLFLFGAFRSSSDILLFNCGGAYDSFVLSVPVFRLTRSIMTVLLFFFSLLLIVQIDRVA